MLHYILTLCLEPLIMLLLAESDAESDLSTDQLTM
jgi:hypothetical protein